MGRVIHFEIAVDDLARASKFYESVGWSFADAGMPGMEYWLAKTGEEGTPGIDGAIMPRSYSKQPVRITVTVDDIDDTMDKVRQAGGNIDSEKDLIPGVGYYVNATDTEGNQFGILQSVM